MDKHIESHCVQVEQVAPKCEEAVGSSAPMVTIRTVVQTLAVVEKCKKLYDIRSSAI
jgi:hypothetical protein